LANDKLVGNMPTENMVHYFDTHNISLGLNQDKLREAMRMADEIFY